VAVFFSHASTSALCTCSHRITPPQILKAFTPALTLVLCVGAGLERLTWPLATSVMLIAGGTSM
jgi:hypothetical protein